LELVDDHKLVALKLEKKNFLITEEPSLYNLGMFN